MPGHSVPLAGLGGFILLFGFCAFNGGSQLSISNEGDIDKVGLAIANTIIGACGGGLASLVMAWYMNGRKWSYLITLNGTLTGMVAQCAGCNVYEPWSALIIGMLAGISYNLVSSLMLRLRLDDPLDAVAVHFNGGALGVLCVPFFKYGEGIFWQGFEKQAWRQLGINCLGLVTIIAWASFWSCVVFGGLYYLDWLRIDVETELLGNDIVKHGESAYPKDGWIESQYQQAKEGLPPPMKDMPLLVTVPILKKQVREHSSQKNGVEKNGSNQKNGIHGSEENGIPNRVLVQNFTNSHM